MIYRVFGVAALLAAAVLVASTFSDVSDAARRLPNRDGVLIAGHDGSDQQMVSVDSDGNISVEFGTSATAFTVGGPAADDAAASGNPVPMGCMFETTTDAVDNNDIARVNCSAEGAVGQALYNGTALISARQMVNAADTTGIGITAAGLLAQFDDTTPTTVTENQFGNLRMSANGVLYVGGPVADDAAASGNPVPVGGIYNSTFPTYTNLDRAQFQFGSRGALRVQLQAIDGASGPAITAMSADGNSASVNSLNTAGYELSFNGSTWDRQRGNVDETVLASAARTTTTASSDLTNYNNSGLHLQIEVTAITDTPSVVCTIQGKASVSSAYYTILATAAITGVSSNIYRVFPGSTVTANVSANDIIPRIWRVNCVHADADSITYSISASLVD